MPKMKITQKEIDLLKGIIDACREIGYDYYPKCRTGSFSNNNKKSYQLNIDLPETCVRIWTDDESLFEELRNYAGFDLKQIPTEILIKELHRRDRRKEKN